MAYLTSILFCGEFWKDCLFFFQITSIKKILNVVLFSIIQWLLRWHRPCRNFSRIKTSRTNKGRAIHFSRIRHFQIKISIKVKDFRIKVFQGKDFQIKGFKANSFQTKVSHYISHYHVIIIISECDCFTDTVLRLMLCGYWSGINWLHICQALYWRIYMKFNWQFK